MACRMRRTVVCVEQVTGAAAARGPGFCGWRSRQAKGSGAVRDCRRATWSGPVAGWRWSVVLLPCWPGPRPICCPSVCYLCQGLNAPQFAGVDPGLAGMLTARAVATATGAGRPRADAGRDPAGRRAWRSWSWWARCTGSPSLGPDSQGRKLDLLAGRRQSVPNR